MVPIPANLALFLNEPGEGKKQAIERILKGQTDLIDNLLDLGRFWKIKVWFDTPVQIRINKQKAKMVSEHIFAGFFNSITHGLCYRLKGNSRHGYLMGDIYNHIIKYEPAIETADVFKSKEQFIKKFDPSFISQAMIDDLWNGKSSQTGAKYAPSDFKSLSKEGRRLLERFVVHYKKDASGPLYFDSPCSPGLKVYREHHESYGHGSCGRDLTISHQSNQDMVHYASEFPGCGNGRYGLIANRNEYLHLEDD